MDPSGPALLFSGSFLMTDSISLLVIFLFRLSLSSQISCGTSVSRSWSILVASCVSLWCFMVCLLYPLSVLSILISDSVWSFLWSLTKGLSIFIFSTDQFLVLSILIFLVSTFIFALIFLSVIPETLNFFLVALVTTLDCVFVKWDYIPILSPLKLLSCVPEIWGHCFHFDLSPCVSSVLIASSTHYFLRILFCLHVFPVFLLIYIQCLILVVGKDAW